MYVYIKFIYIVLLTPGLDYKAIGFSVHSTLVVLVLRIVYEVELFSSVAGTPIAIRTRYDSGRSGLNKVKHYLLFGCITIIDGLKRRTNLLLLIIYKN